MESIDFLKLTKDQRELWGVYLNYKCFRNYLMSLHPYEISLKTTLKDVDKICKKSLKT